MEKEEFQIRIMDYLSGQMDEKQRAMFEKEIASDPECQKQFDAAQSTWKQLDNLERTIPEPSESMDTAFYGMLYDQVEAMESTSVSFLDQLLKLLQRLWKPQLAYGIILLGIGLVAGYLMNDQGNVEPANTTIVDSNETEEVREKLVLTLLDQPSANKRLQAVSEATKLNSATESIINALFTTLNNDPNINVRLAALESLTKYVEKPEVRMGFIQAISKQESPLVQIALADLMVRLQEKSSVDSMKQLLEKPGIDTTVKQKLEESINHII
ncbi:MAG: HEAT repeat domain-containing protein [Flavobacteriaceae bacterium]